MEYLNKNQAKIDALNNYLKGMLTASSGAEKRFLYHEYKDYISDIKAIDIFYLDVYQDKTPLSIEEIKNSADQFVNVFSSSLMENVPDYNHRYFDLVLAENEAITNHFDALKSFIKNPSISKVKNDILNILETSKEITLMFEKRENILFSKLENKTPSKQPFKVMWELHNDAKALLRELISILKSPTFNEQDFKFNIGQFYFLIYGIIQKHEIILLPVANMFLSQKELDQMEKDMFDFGFALINPKRALNNKENKQNQTIPNLFQTETGSLNRNQLILMFNHLPLDLTYVDKDDKVVYYNNRKERHFPRNPSIIGRLVEDCHPPKSVHIVKQIVEDFKNGKRDIAEFYIHFKSKYLYITYYPLFDENNEYQGVLEVSQDITRINQLKGEKRLLDES